MNKAEIIIYKVINMKAEIILKQLIVVNTNVKCYSYNQISVIAAVSTQNKPSKQ
jgi:hypothetical protein